MTDNTEESGDQKATLQPGPQKKGSQQKGPNPKGARRRSSQPPELPGRGQVDWESLDEDPTPLFEKSAWLSSRRRQLPQTPGHKRGRSKKAAAKTPPPDPALVLSVGAKRCTADLGGKRLDCRLPSSLAAHQRFGLAVGDLVELSRNRGTWWVREVLERRTELARVDPKDPRQRKVIAANIDLVVVVAGMRKPGLKTGLLDRYLLAVESSGAEILLCINKIDLAQASHRLPREAAEMPGDPKEDEVPATQEGSQQKDGEKGRLATEGSEDRFGDSELAALEPYRQLGHRIVLCSASTGQGIQELLAALEGKTCVFVGHSGVGKSSLLNALQPDLQLAALSVRESDGTGRHTTTRSNLYRLEGETRIIDTPGVRELGLWDIGPDEIRRSFPELVDFSSGCRFANCTHTHEPDCTVKEAVQEGAIPKARYEAYLRILSSTG
ncbi:MAG: ribosome small subunit-dependent GTPase A [Deltaproteobacteria bacterium]|nr:ribosome small subunit-dependent GTPase A [Deltaproteobacteria bacterium]